MSKFSSDRDLSNQSQIYKFNYSQPFRSFQSDECFLTETLFPLWFVLSHQLLLSWSLSGSSLLDSWAQFSLKSWSVSIKTHWNPAKMPILVATYICYLNNLICSYIFINHPNALDLNVYVIGHQLFCKSVVYILSLYFMAILSWIFKRHLELIAL